jgi:SAM-dependent methyltransferase
LVGSEYIGDKIPYGKKSASGIRNESITSLTWLDESFDYILSFDVFEHVPDYYKALSECYRVLRKGGIILFTVPFLATSEKNVVRATVSDSGEITHILEPEYHGDPIKSEGCLAFYHYGWELLDSLKDVGFQDVKSLVYWSPELGYVGGEQMIFYARK